MWIYFNYILICVFIYTELNVTFHNEAEAISKEWLLQIKFDCCQDRVHRYIESISEVFDQFCSAASLGRITPDQINHSMYFPIVYMSIIESMLVQPALSNES